MQLDSLLGATAYHHYAKNRLNEFVEAWDGLSSKDCQRLIVVGATNRPFDLDEDVISHMQRRYSSTTTQHLIKDKWFWGSDGHVWFCSLGFT